MSNFGPSALVAFCFLTIFFVIFVPCVYHCPVLYALQHYMIMYRPSDALHIVHIVYVSMLAINRRCEVLKF